MKEPNPFPAIPADWIPPGELSGPTPRQLNWTTIGIVYVVMALLIFFVGLGIVAGVWDESNRDHRLKQEAQEIDATVTRAWTESGKTTHYHVAYEFSLNGQPVRGESEIPQRRWKGLPAGSHLQVKYVPARPEINRPAGAYERMIPYWVPLVAFLFWIGMLALAVFPIRKERRLLKYGQPAMGVITNSPTGRRPKYGYIVKYQFYLQDGSTIEGNTQKDGWFHQGAEVCIIYNPKRPRSNGLYPLKLSRIRQ